MLDNGSTDSTWKILGDMAGVTVTRNPPHLPDHTSLRYETERHKLMCKAAEGADYILHMNADAHLPPDHMECITKRMDLDSIAVACSFDPESPKHHMAEPGMVIDVKWLNTHATLIPYPLRY